MIITLIAVLAMSVVDLPGKSAPPVLEPDWNAWQQIDGVERRKSAETWRVLLDHRPDRKYTDEEDFKAAREAVAAAYELMSTMPNSTCAVGADLLRKSQDDWERLVIANCLKQLGGAKGEAFLVWAMTKVTDVDRLFEPIFEKASELAKERRPEYLPALFSILRTHDGQIDLPLHSWFIPTHDCLFYVFGRYSRDVVPYLYPLLKHKDAYVRRNAAIVLGFFMDFNAKPALLEVLAADDVGSGGAAFAIGQFGSKDAVGPVCKLLKNRDSITRFWASYALYELGSKDALPALESALVNENDQIARAEMSGTIEYLRTGPSPPKEKAGVLGKLELRDALKAAKEADGLEAEFKSIEASAGVDELDQLEEIRRRTMDIPSDLGHKCFVRWTRIITAIHRRATKVPT